MDASGDFESAARQAWSQAISDFYHPPLPEPVIEHDEKASSFFYIDSGSWTVHLNTAGVPQSMDAETAEPFLRSISHHEIQHYLLCPFDGVTNGMMFSAARKHLPDDLAMFVCNVFADLVVDSFLLKRYQNITWSRITESIRDSAIRTQDHSPLWILVIAVYHHMWGFPLPDIRIDDETLHRVAKDIVIIASKHIDTERKWPKATDEIAKVIAEWLPDPEDELGGTGLKESPGDGSLLVPSDLDGVMGSPVENRNGDRARKCLHPEEMSISEDELERLAREVEARGGSFKDLEAVYMISGGGTMTKDWIRFWYRAKSRGLLRFHVTSLRPSGEVPLTPSAWRLGDPIEELDIVQSLQAFPVLVPNMSTRRWIRTVSYGESSHKSLPDLLLVLDSSGSMQWSMGAKDLRGEYHVALVSAFAAMDTSLRRGCKVAAINFSGSILKSGWTRERSELERVLMAYQGGGTVMPVKDIKTLCNESVSPVMSIIITDAGVSNWNPFVKTIASLAKNGHKMFIFHIGGNAKPSKSIQELERAGATIIPVSSAKELPGLVVSEVRRVYSKDT